MVLSHVSVAIRAGEFIGVFGPNGAGKTTLLHAILGLAASIGGEIKVLGRPPTRGNRDAGYLPQQRASVAELRLRGWDFVASALYGERWGLPLPGAGRRREVGSAIATVEAEISPAGFCASFRVANCSGCCWRKRCSASQNCCCWMNRC